MNRTLLTLLIISIVLISACTKVPKEEFTIPDTPVVDHTANMVEGLRMGNLAPSYEITTLEGETVTRDEQLSSEKPTLVYFFATWCPHCAHDFSTLSKVYKDYEDDVDIVASSLDNKESQSQIESYKARYAGLEGVQFATAHGTVLRDYNVIYTTTKYGINKDGVIKYVGSGAFSEDQWRTLLDLLKNS